MKSTGALTFSAKNRGRSLLVGFIFQRVSLDEFLIKPESDIGEGVAYQPIRDAVLTDRSLKQIGMSDGPIGYETTVAYPGDPDPFLVDRCLNNVLGGRN